jgi:hypothetical protein
MKIVHRVRAAGRMRAALVALALCALQAGCVAWTYEQAPVATVVAKSPPRLWVPLGADSFVVLMHPRVVSDSLVGLIEGSAAPGEPLRRYAEPVSSISRVATEDLDPRYTVTGALAIFGLVGTLLFGGFILGVGR